MESLISFKKKENPLKLEARARESAIKEANDLLKLTDLDAPEVFSMVQRYGNGDPSQMRQNLSGATENPDLKMTVYLLGDLINRSSDTLRIEWNPPKDLKFDSSMRTYDILKPGDPCIPIQPAVWCKYKSPISQDIVEVQIRHMIVKPSADKE